MALGDYLHALLDLFYPRYCLHCNCSLNNSREIYICEDCKKKIPYVTDTYCVRCGADTGPYITYTVKEGCAVCKGKYLHFNAVTSVTHYNGVIKILIHKFKYARQKFLFRVLNDILIKHKGIKENIADVDIIVPVPLHWIKKLHRGFNQSELLSLGIQRYFSKPIIRNNLCRIKNTEAQTLLSKNQRKLNIHNAFFVRQPELFKGKKILLVDDVLTTGATASECSKKLKESGAESVHLLVLATAEYNN